MHLIGNLGDVVVLLPAAVGLAVALYAYGARRDAAAFSIALIVCLVAALVAKLTFAVCGLEHSGRGVESPSGHAAFSAMFYGCFAIVLATGRGIRRQLAIYGAAVALIVVVGVSRVAIAVHTAPEVVVGLSIGAASIVIFCMLRGAPRRLDLSSREIVRLSPFALVYGVGVLILAGHWSAEPLIDVFAAELGAKMHLCRPAETGDARLHAMH